MPLPLPEYYADKLKNGIVMDKITSCGSQETGLILNIAHEAKVQILQLTAGSQMSALLAQCCQASWFLITTQLAAGPYGFPNDPWANPPQRPRSWASSLCVCILCMCGGDHLCQSRRLHLPSWGSFSIKFAGKMLMNWRESDKARPHRWSGGRKWKGGHLIKGKHKNTNFAGQRAE